MALPTPTHHPHTERERALALLKRFGWNATSFQCLEPGFQYWFDDEDACVAYVDTGRAWVAAGAPIAPPARFADVARRFLRAAAEADRRVCFFAVEQRFVDLIPCCAISIGEQPVWNPAEWPTVLASSRSLREQLRRARAKGVRVCSLEPGDLSDPAGEQRRSVDALIHRWLVSRPMPAMGFLVQIAPFSFPGERRFFVAEREGHVVGFLAMVPVYARNGWLAEDLLRDRSAPNGTAELLVDAAMRAAEAEGSTYLTLGLAPLSGGVGGWLRRIRSWSSGLYNFEGLRAFRERLRPSNWSPLYLSFPRSQAELVTLYDVLAAFSRHGLLRFGLETLLRVPEIGLRVLAGLLVPWILMLALANTHHWFPARWVQDAWVIFDLGVLFGLVALCTAWRQRLAALLATVITGDALLTAGEAVAYNLPRARSPLDLIVTAASVLAPLSAAALLWGAWAHRRTRH